MAVSTPVRVRSARPTGSLVPRDAGNRRGPGARGGSPRPARVGDERHRLEVARAARLWGDGTSVRDIARQVLFVRLCLLALAAEEGPERIVAEQWRHIREQAQKMDWPEWKLLIEAAYREPKLRPLYPYISHYSLRFSTTTGQPLSPDCMVVHAVPGRPYVVSRRLSMRASESSSRPWPLPSCSSAACTC